MGGRITVMSEPTAGSTFSVELAAANATDEFESRRES
jgi:signal transduction histidine kinase